MAAPATTRRQRLEARESAIVAAAHEMFVNSGYKGARMAEIARRARVAEGTLYLYFKNKEALLEAVIAAFYRRLTQGAEHGVAERSQTFERLEFLARHHLQECLAEWSILELMIGMYRPMDAYECSGCLRFNKTYVAVFDGVIREGVHRGELCETTPIWGLRDLFYGTLEYSARTLKLHQRIDADLEQAVKLVLAALRGAAAAPLNPGGPPRTEDLSAVARRLEAVAKRLEQSGL